VSSYELGAAAARDLDEILEYLRVEAGVERAELIRRELLSAMQRLARYPESGHSRQDLTDRPVLFWAVHEWMIVYRSETKPIQIVRVLSGWRDLESILGSR
jgi:plasmid stabilization system protein ParE